MYSSSVTRVRLRSERVTFVKCHGIIRHLHRKKWAKQKCQKRLFWLLKLRWNTALDPAAAPHTTSWWVWGSGSLSVPKNPTPLSTLARRDSAVCPCILPDVDIHTHNWDWCKQGVVLTGRNTTGPPRAAPWWVTLRRGVLQTPTDDDGRRRQTHGEQNNTAPYTMCRRASNNVLLILRAAVHASLQWCECDVLIFDDVKLTDRVARNRHDAERQSGEILTTIYHCRPRCKSPKLFCQKSWIYTKTLLRILKVGPTAL